MLVEKPAWIGHSGNAIFSIDIHPDGKRVATGGGDNKVRIWSTAPVLRPDLEKDPVVPKSLAVLGEHSLPVQVVRWSHSGRQIASGADDKIAFVHELWPGSGQVVFGSGDAPNLENWKAVLTLRGHQADVVDLAWSPDDSFLATCSLDRTVRIWRTAPGAAAGALVTVLIGHRSFVKGVAWDPVGSFLATQSDDKTVVVWRTKDWGVEKRIQGPYEKTVGSTFFRRLDWSPCGNYLTTTNAYENPSHTAAVIERGGDWSKYWDFVGHVAPVISVRYNHTLFKKAQEPAASSHQHQQQNGPKQPEQSVQNGGMEGGKTFYSIIAIGSQDCKLSVWTTNRPKPVFIAKHFFQQCVADLTWSPDGYVLMCCSTDGTVAAFVFDKKELGEKLTAAEMNYLLNERYGGMRGGAPGMAESPAQLILEQEFAALAASQPPPNRLPGGLIAPQVMANGGAAQASSNPMLSPMRAASGLPGQGGSPLRATRQVEERRADGRRRIVPVMISGPNVAPDGAVGGLASPAMANGEPLGVSSRSPAVQATAGIASAPHFISPASAGGGGWPP